MSDPFVSTDHLSSAELDERLENAVVQNTESEKLICGYLRAVRERGVFREFGFINIYDYAAERFGFAERKTRYLLALAKKLQELPKIRAALTEGKIGWCKASRIASRATRDNETMWLDSALSLSVRELDRRIKDGTDSLASMLHFWATESQRAAWENSLELCRRMVGANISPGEALELMAGEFFATYAHNLAEDEVDEAEAPTQKHEEAAAVTPSPKVVEERVCPENRKELPTPLNLVSDDAFTRRVLERDGYACQYPGCSARKHLHAHHIVFRSRGGTNDPGNGVTLCAFHHRMLHGELIKVSGRAPEQLEWLPPKVMKFALTRRRRNGLYVGELDVLTTPSSAGKRLPETDEALGVAV